MKSKERKAWTREKRLWQRRKAREKAAYFNQIFKGVKTETLKLVKKLRVFKRHYFLFKGEVK